MTEFSTSKGKQIIKTQTGKRVSKDAADTLMEEVEEYARKRAEDIMEKTQERNRVTVRAEDVKDTR